jgi:hypothetical protein
VKKLFTLLFTVLAVSGLYAQSGRHDGYKGDQRDPYDEKNTRSTTHIRMPDRFDRREWLKARDAQLFGINREFDSRIIAIKYRRNLTQREKRRLVAALERQRHEQLEMVYRRFDDRRMIAENRSGRMY